MKRRISFSLSIAALVLCALGANLFAQEERRPENESLLETIKIEAANMEVFPVDLFADSRDGAIYQKSVAARSKKFGGELRARRWDERYEFTFERYLPLFRFKTRAGLARPEEIDECADRFDSLTTREKALAITAIFIYERIRRRPLTNENRMKPNGSLKERFPYYPFYPLRPQYYDLTTLIFPPYEPDDSIPNDKWDKWLSTIESCLNVEDEAFPAYKTTDEITASDTDSEPLPPDNQNYLLWNEQFNYCRDLAASLLNDSNIYYGLDDSSFQRGRDFLKQVHELELDPSRSRFDPTFALRDYYFIVAKKEELNVRGNSPRRGNSSFVPKTLGDIADQLLKSRLEYEPSEPIQTP
ncbi:MAG: hypothetical protein IJM30_09865 [Thermoguttaceae bacterium]|nr:hypothetical protein [Thermoguttaceae bacterium]